jgi:hypothetical protein
MSSSCCARRGWVSAHAAATAANALARVPGSLIVAAPWAAVSTSTAANAPAAHRSRRSRARLGDICSATLAACSGRLLRSRSATPREANDRCQSSVIVVASVTARPKSRCARAGSLSEAKSPMAASSMLRLAGSAMCSTSSAARSHSLCARSVCWRVASAAATDDVALARSITSGMVAVRSAVLSRILSARRASSATVAERSINQRQASLRAALAPAAANASSTSRRASFGSWAYAALARRISVNSPARPSRSCRERL